MIYDENKDFQVPLEERILIYPKERQQYFKNLLDNYTRFCPYLKLLYAALNYNSELKVDYIVIFESISKNKKVIVWDAPFLYTNRAIPAYRYAVKTNNFKGFFDSAVMHFAVMPYSNFFSFVQSKFCNFLTLRETDDKYWKNPKNMNDLIKGVVDCGMQYRPSGFKPKPLRADIPPNEPPLFIKKESTD